MNKTSRRALLISGLAALLLVMPASIRAWRLDQLTLHRIQLPSILRLATGNSAVDLDGDGAPEELALTAGRAVIWTGNRSRWQSPSHWQVDQARITDLNRDGIPEVTLLVWRPFKAWPVDAWLPHGGRIEDFHDAKGMSCHIILIGWKQASFRELWAGSAMADPVKSFTVADLEGNGSQYLITLEAEYDDPVFAPARRLKVWEWNGFGFTVVHDLDASFPLISIAKTENGQEVILAP